jgi:DNA-binding response OmpR family regulator
MVMHKQTGLRVLVVSDEQAFADSLVRCVQVDGHEVVLVRDGLSALAAARSALPDVVFLEGRLLGLEAEAGVKGIQGLSAWKRPLFVAFAGENEPESASRSGGSWIDLFLVRPVNPDKVQSLLRRFQRIVQDTADFDPAI